ncbi:interferon-induced, double-stranded RNA-activated protein kinase-like isoform X2 [Anabas testudineus]|uniref:interferon-induced, double-stranded RNA-activated protein kinase-like isoform X2 n=1 Tax=Anabas testudineus TaxID=64144 RepID=UPI000E45514B|nr:interferon-induced, double-stranded RNA-activated protein kinase-like isoform X2 [Anabas testudineus]
MMDTGTNYVAELNDYSQKTRSKLKYEDVDWVGAEHNKTFTQRVVFNGVVYPDGVGKNKKEAKLDAARRALDCLRAKEQPDSVDTTENAAEASTASGHQITDDINYICWLNQYGQRNRVTVKAVESTKLGPNSTVQCCRFVVDDVQYPVVSGKTKREAKEEAAKLVYDVINGSKTTETAGENCNHTSDQLTEEINQNISEICVISNNNSFKETNFIGLVNHYCQKANITSHYFMEAEKCGPAHNPQFFYRLVIDNKEYPVGEGKNKQEAKQNAAQLALSALQEQSDWDSKVSVRSTASEDDAPAPALSTSSENYASTNVSTPSSVVTLCRFTSEFDSIKHLGKGGFGRVYKAREKLLDRHYAIKIVNYEEEALREVKALSDLSHQHIIRYYVCWVEDSEYKQDITDSDSSESFSELSQVAHPSPQYLYIKMELCETGTLEDWIQNRNNITQQDSRRREEGLNIAQQIVSGVVYIHSNNLIHRDLKPANIMFGQDSHVKIGDFGLVTAEKHKDTENLLDRTAYKGTPSYMAPEQKTEANYDHKVDIFALGLIYFELLWKLSTLQERAMIWDDVRNYKFPREFAQTFFQEDQIIKLMLCKKPEDRPEASVLKEKLEDFKKQKMRCENLTV